MAWGVGDSLGGNSREPDSSARATVAGAQTDRPTAASITLRVAPVLVFALANAMVTPQSFRTAQALGWGARILSQSRRVRVAHPPEPLATERRRPVVRGKAEGRTSSSCRRRHHVVAFTPA